MRYTLVDNGKVKQAYVWMRLDRAVCEHAWRAEAVVDTPTQFGTFEAALCGFDAETGQVMPGQYTQCRNCDRLVSEAGGVPL
jgi:hypothetical protein